MECINGEWIMAGCSQEDLGRLNTVDDLLCLIKTDLYL